MAYRCMECGAEALCSPEVDDLQKELERRTAWSNEQIHQLESQLDVHTDTIAKLRAERDDNENAWSCEKQKRAQAESERDTARSDLEAMKLVAKAYQDAEAALQAKVARAVAGLEKAVDVSGNRWSEWGSRAESVAEHVDAALEALR